MWKKRKLIRELQSHQSVLKEKAREKARESISAVIPIVLIVFILGFTVGRVISRHPGGIPGRICACDPWNDLFFHGSRIIL